MKLSTLRLTRMTSAPSFKSRLLVYLLLLSSIPVALMGIFSAYTTSGIIRDQAAQSNALLLKQTEKELNSFFKKIDDLMLQYTYAASTSTLMLKRFVDEDLSNKNWKSVNDLGEILVKLQSGMEHVLELDFYSVPYGKVLSSHGKLYTDRQYVDPLAIDEAKKLTYSNRWIGLRMPISDAAPLDRPVLTIIKPVIQNNRVDAALIVYLDAAAISSYKLSPPAPYEGSSIFITDDKGNIVLHSQTAKIGSRLDEEAFQQMRQTENADWIRQGDLRLNGVSYNTAVLHSDARSWYYVAAVPEKAFTSKANTQRNIMLSISIALVLAALFISYRASRTIYRPLQLLTSKVTLPPSAGNSGAEGDEVALLGRYFETLNLKNEQLAKEITLYSDHARHFLLHQLLVGNTPLQNSPFTNQEPFTDYYPFVPLLIVELNRIRIMEHYSRQDCSLYYFAVENITKEILGDHGQPQVIMIQPGMFVAIVSMPAPLAPDHLRALGLKLLEAIRRYLKLEAYIAVSYSDTGADGLHEAFDEASGLLRYRFIVGDNQVILTHDLEASVSIQADVLFQYENDIVLAIRERKWSEAETIFLTLTDTLQESFSISEDLLRSYFPQLLSGIVKSVRSLPQGPFDADRVQRLLPDLAECRTLEEIKDFFRNSVFAILHQEYKDTNAASQRVQQVLDYIQAHYDTDLSLQHCAELVHLHTFDLSRLFKQVTGVKFIDYLIDFRMQKAMEMLNDPQLKLQDIADKLRYTSLQGFMRAFKKSTGMTPGQYRSKLKE